MQGTVVTEVEGEVFTHRVLWRAADRLARGAEEQRGGLYFHLAAMLMLYFVVEAYLNFLLDVLAPDDYANERKLFRSDLRKKARHVSTLAGVDFADQTDNFTWIGDELAALRDKVAHAKSGVYRRTFRRVDLDSLPLLQPSEFDRRVSPANCATGMRVVREFCEWLHAGARTRVDGERLRRLGVHPLDDSPQVETGRSTIR